MASEGETVKAGALIGVIGEADEDITAAASDSITTSAAVKTAGPKTPAPVSRTVRGSERKDPARSHRPARKHWPQNAVSTFRPFKAPDRGTNRRGRRGESRRRRPDRHARRNRSAAQPNAQSHRACHLAIARRRSRTFISLWTSPWKRRSSSANNSSRTVEYTRASPI